MEVPLYICMLYDDYIIAGNSAAYGRRHVINPSVATDVSSLFKGKTVITYILSWWLAFIMTVIIIYIVRTIDSIRTRN